MVNVDWFTMVGVLTLYLLGLLGTDFLPKDDVGQLSYTVELPIGATMDETLSAGELYANELRLQPEAEISRVGTAGSSLNKEGNNIVWAPSLPQPGQGWCAPIKKSANTS